MATKRIESFLGKQVKSYNGRESEWIIDPESVMSLSSAMLKKVVKIKVYSSKYGEDRLYAVVYLQGNKCVSWNLDLKFEGHAGDLIDPKTFKVFKRINERLGKDKELCYGKVSNDVDDLF